MWIPKEHDLVILTEPVEVVTPYPGIVKTKIGTKGTIVSVLDGAYYVEIADGGYESEIVTVLPNQMERDHEHTNL